jgi:putative RNA 2'-phosphotransferase
MSTERHEQLSKFLSFVLRHKPGAIELTLDPNGWASIDDLITKCREHGTSFSREELFEVVGTSDKKRFSLSGDQLRIRAAQGHSISVDIGLAPGQPPAVLYHGTATRFVNCIMAEGLKPGGRQHVHLSHDADTARRVGERHGRPAVLRVDACGMLARGWVFYRADNGVWLTAHVPPDFLELIAPSSRLADSATTSRQPNPSRKTMK